MQSTHYSKSSHSASGADKPDPRKVKLAHLARSLRQRGNIPEWEAEARLEWVNRRDPVEPEFITTCLAYFRPWPKELPPEPEPPEWFEEEARRQAAEEEAAKKARTAEKRIRGHAQRIREKGTAANPAYCELRQRNAGATVQLDDEMLRRIIAELWGREPEPVGWVAANTIEPKNIHWLWEPRLKAGVINLVTGLGDVGKDQLCCALAAPITTGAPWPDGSPGPEPGIVGYISAEDDAADTLIPRLLANGADLSRIRIWCGSKRPTPADLAELDVLIVSPLLDLMDRKKNMNREQDARDFLALWQGSGCTVIGTAHYGKNADLGAAQRVLGASGIANFCRSIWTVLRDDEDPNTRLFVRLKANLTPDAVEGLQYVIEHVGPWSQSTRVRVIGNTSKRADDVLRGKARDGADETAKAFVIRFLTDCAEETEANIVISAGEMIGHKAEAIKKAASDLVKSGVIKKRKEAGKLDGKWLWDLASR